METSEKLVTTVSNFCTSTLRVALNYYSFYHAGAPAFILFILQITEYLSLEDTRLPMSELSTCVVPTVFSTNNLILST